MFFRKLLNRNEELEEIIKEQEIALGEYQTANNLLKDEIKSLVDEISAKTDCAVGSWCKDCKHIKYVTMPNEPMLAANACLNRVNVEYDKREGYYELSYCGKYSHNICKEWENK